MSNDVTATVSAREPAACALSLLFVFGIALIKASVWVTALGTIAGLLVLVPPFHMFAQLKGGYRLSTCERCGGR